MILFGNLREFETSTSLIGETLSMKNCENSERTQTDWRVHRTLFLNRDGGLHPVLSDPCRMLRGLESR
jgi:hypothetical protein